MPTSVDTPPPTHREVTPIRTCHRCGCYLRSFHEGEICEPCGVPKAERVENVDGVDVVAAIAELPTARQRQIAFEAYDEMMREQGIAA